MPRAFGSSACGTQSVCRAESDFETGLERELLTRGENQAQGVAERTVALDEVVGSKRGIERHLALAPRRGIGIELDHRGEPGEGIDRKAAGRAHLGEYAAIGKCRSRRGGVLVVVLQGEVFDRDLKGVHI